MNAPFLIYVKETALALYINGNRIVAYMPEAKDSGNQQNLTNR